MKPKKFVKNLNAFVTEREVLQKLVSGKSEGDFYPVKTACDVQVNKTAVWTENKIFLSLTKTTSKEAVEAQAVVRAHSHLKLFWRGSFYPIFI